MRDEAKAKNEELFRSVNEQIEAVSQAVPPDDATMEFLCECANEDWHERLDVTRAEYESVRAVGTHFIVMDGHQDDDIEHITFSNDRFLVVEKEGVAATDAEESDPRS